MWCAAELTGSPQPNSPNPADDPEVEYISPDHEVYGALQFAQPAINANIAFQNGFDGTGVGVAIIDSGIMTHPDTSNRIVYNENFVPNIGSDYFDRYGHGTHVAGIVGGDAVESAGPIYTHTFRGISPNVTLINLRVLDANGSGQDSTVIAAIQRAIQLKSTYNIRVINLSLGRPVVGSYTKDPLCQAVEQAWKAGIVVVVAAGNYGRNNSANTNGYGTITAPGNDPYVITVGAMKDMGTTGRGDDLIASYSSKGPTMLDHVVKPDLVAPGNLIISSLPAGLTLTNLYPQNSVSDSYYMLNGPNQPSTYYFTLSGTSMAAPMVSGAAALMIQKDPSTLRPIPGQGAADEDGHQELSRSYEHVAVDPVTLQTLQRAHYDVFMVGVRIPGRRGAAALEQHGHDFSSWENSPNRPAPRTIRPPDRCRGSNHRTWCGARPWCGARMWCGVRPLMLADRMWSGISNVVWGSST